MAARILLACLCAYVIAVAAGIARFVGTNAPFEFAAPRSSTADDASSANLVALATGPTLRASSFERDVYDLAHPAYLVDGRERPTAQEKWTPRFDDPAPWLEIAFREPHDVERVVLRHESDVERRLRPNKQYRIRCLGGDSASVLDVKSNRDSLSSHELRCRRALGVRLEFTPARKRRPALYEVEVYGR